MTIRLLSLGPLLLFILFAPGTPWAAPCTCSDLSTLQAELRNAIRLESGFRAQSARLRSLPRDASQAALRQFAEGEARRGLESRAGGGPDAVDYVPYGASVSDEHFDRLEPGQTPQQRREQLCAMSAVSAAALAAAVRNAACDGIGRALRAHEAVHLQMCRSSGYRAYLGMHGADRAAEEAEAYGAQIATLRAEIFRVLEGAGLRLEVTSNSRASMQNNPVWRAILTDVQAEILVTRAGTTPAGASLARFDGQGRQTSTVRVEGNCRFTAGDSMTLPATAAVETDGLEARIEYAVAGTSPTIGMQCQVGGGRGMAMSFPVPVSGALPPGVALPLRPVSEHVADLSRAQAAAIMAPGGVQLTGQARVRLVLTCP